MGGGSGGSVVANRLSEKYNVLLLEIGGTPPPISEIPFFKPLLVQTAMTFSYFTLPQDRIGQAYIDEVKLKWRRGILQRDF